MSSSIRTEKLQFSRIEKLARKGGVCSSSTLNIAKYLRMSRGLPRKKNTEEQTRVEPRGPNDFWTDIVDIWATKSARFYHHPGADFDTEANKIQNSR